MGYAIKKETHLDFDEVVLRLKEELKKEGFGIITEIDVKKTMREKIGVDREEYIILGACNPNFAHKALSLEKDLGLLLPCNVIAYKDGDKTVVAAIKPLTSMKITGNKELNGIAKQVEDKLKRVITAIPISGPQETR